MTEAERYGDLRPYQIDAIEQIRAAIAAGTRNICLSASTGAGKTKIAAFMVREACRRLKRVVFVCDRINLIDQTSMVFDAERIPHGVMQAQHPRARPWERVQVCSVQTLARRKWPPADLIIVDECHTISDAVRRRISRRDCITVGLTATPFSKGMGKLYDQLVSVATTDGLIATGYLAPYRIYAAKAPDMTGVPLVGGEWDSRETSRRALAVVGDCVSEYLKLGQGRKFICSAVDTAHVQELERQFLAAGIVTRAYTYREDDVERAEVVTEFRRRDSFIRGLITVTAASKGFDVPDVGVVIMARPLRRSHAEYIQLFGRGLRTAPGKDQCIVLDHSGNSERFWDFWTRFFAEGAQSLDDGRPAGRSKASEKAEQQPCKCPACAHLHLPLPYCPACGHLYPPRDAIKHLPGTLVELAATRDPQATTHVLFPQIVAEAQRRGKGENWALSKFRAITGHWPQADFHATLPVTATQEVRNKLRSLDIAYAKGANRGRAA